MSTALRWRLLITAGPLLIVLLADEGCVRRNPTQQIGAGVTAGGGHSCRTTVAGLVECWGMNDQGQVGNGRFSTTVTVMTPVAGLSGVTVVSAGMQSHTCAVAGGAVSCWGANGSGQLGNGNNTRSNAPVSTGITGATDVAAGRDFTCAVVAGGSVQCWGDNHFGQLGNGTNTPSTTPVNTGITGATHVAAGAAHACAIVGSGTVQCWGTGPIGTTAGTSKTPVAVPNITDATVIVASLTNTCLLRATGAVMCWGANFHGENGDGSATVTSSVTPVAVQGITNAIAVAIGGSHGCAVLTGGSVKCWGDNGYGQLGVGDVTAGLPCASTSPPCTATPMQVPGITNAVDVAAGDSHTCVALADDRVMCWGWDGYGQVGRGTHGNGNAAFIVYRPVFATGVALALGGTGFYSHGCAMLANQSVKCWGTNAHGEVGDGTTSLRQPLAQASQGVTTAASISSGSHTCAAMDDATVRCWGNNPLQQIGPGGAQDKQVTPLALPLTRVAGVVAAQMSTCVLRTDVGTVPEMRCFGANEHGQLGVPSTGMTMCPGLVARACTPTPMLVPGISPTSISGGESHTCAIVERQRVYCWGSNLKGQLGEQDPADGPVIGLGTTVSPTPRKLLFAKRVVAIASGSEHNCLIDITGAVHCWGNNTEGELGDGTTITHTQLTAVPGITNATAIVAGGGYSCALLSDGTVKCWGSNGLGQLGQGSNTGPQTCGNSACSKAPVTVPGVTGGTAISTSTGALSTCVALANRTVTCWGANADGQLGRGTTTLFEPTAGLMTGP